MRLWQFWWRTLVLSTQYNPPEFVELMMTSLAMALLATWGYTSDWPYLVLSSSFAMGAAVSMWVRGTTMPSSNSRMVQVMAILLLLYSFYTFCHLLDYI